jgi:toxin ParE1/3/4
MDADRYRLGAQAIQDLQSILLESERMFGPSQRQTYTDLFHRAAGLIATEPQRIGSKTRDELRQGLRSFHLDRAAGRRGAASHSLYYVESVLEDGAPGVTILRILHDHMDPERHVTGDLR